MQVIFHPDTSLPLIPVTSARVLGVQIDSSLKWNSHLANASRTAARRIFFIVQLRRSGVRSKTLWQLYFMLIRSCLAYGFPVFSNAPASGIQCLVRVERRLEKIIGEPCPKPLLIFLEKVGRGFVQNISLYPMHPLREFFGIQHFRTRHYGHLLCPRARTERFRQSFIRYLK